MTTPLRTIPQTAGKGLSNQSSSTTTEFSDAFEVADVTYTVESIPFAPLVLSGGASVVSLDDDEVSEEIDLPFTFTFYGIAYQSFFISSNGFITFSSAGEDGCCNGLILPLGAGGDEDGVPLAIIAGYWTDLVPSMPDTLFYEFQGSTPNRVAVIQFDQRPIIESNLLVTCQIVLYETSNLIEIHTYSAKSDFDHRVTQGIQNADGTRATVVPGRMSTFFDLDEDAVRFTPIQGIEATTLFFQDEKPLLSGICRETVLLRSGTIAHLVDEAAPLLIALENEVLTPLFLSMELVYNTRPYQGYDPGASFSLSWAGEAGFLLNSNITTTILGATSHVYVPAFSLLTGHNDNSTALSGPTEDFRGKSLYLGLTETNPSIGGIDTAVSNNTGSYYFAGQRVLVDGGDGLAELFINGVAGEGSEVASFTISEVGSGYDLSNNPHSTTAAGDIAYAFINVAGTGYMLNDICTITGGGDDATVTVTQLQGPTYPIQTLNQGAQEFRIFGDHTAEFTFEFLEAATFLVGNSTGNNGVYTVDHSSYVPEANLTIITTVEAFPDLTPDGYLDLGLGVVAEVTLTNRGTGYSTAEGVETTGGHGTGLTLNTYVGSGLAVDITRIAYGDGELYLNITYERTQLRSEALLP